MPRSPIGLRAGPHGLLVYSIAYLALANGTRQATALMAIASAKPGLTYIGEADADGQLKALADQGAASVTAEGQVAPM